MADRMLRRAQIARGIVAGALGLGLIGADAPWADGGESYFAVDERGGAWWFIDPLGQPFLSHGVNVLSPGADKDSYDAARPQYAAWRYYENNAAWADAATRRLKAWKFNTVGGWAHDAVPRAAMPHTPVLHLGAEVGVPWNDLLADSFPRRMDQLARQRVAPHRDDVRLIGWFTDNELAWYPELLLHYHSKQPAENKTRGRLIELLRSHYQGDFGALRRDFSVSGEIDNFDELASGGSLKLVPSGDGHAVVADFTELLADRYYQAVCEAIRKHDPNHLILGDRYHGYCPDEVARAAGRHVDVVSTNYDWPRGVDGFLPKFYLRRLHALSGKPILVTEYYSAAADNRSGNPNTGGLFVVVDNQRQRAAVVQRRLELFADEPYVVGAHWFAYSDEPPHGRPRDGEDYNFGLVDIHDEPYAEVTSVIQRMHGAAVDRHATAAALATETEAAVVKAAPLAEGAPLDRVDATLLSQAEVTPQDAGGLADLHAAWNDAAIYLTVAGNHCVMNEAYAEQPTSTGEGLQWTVTLASAGGSREARTLELLMLGDKAQWVRGHGELAYWQRGVRFGATLAVPAAAAGRDAWAAGDSVCLASKLRDRRDGRVTTWAVTIKLGRNAPDDRGPAVATIVDEHHRRER